MRYFDQHWLMAGVATQMWRNALPGRYNGLVTPDNARYLERCKASHVSTGTILIFTLDEGMHTSGWWKNPDYERCWHLSLSFQDPLTREPAPKDAKLTGLWLDAFYGDDCRYIWAEPPFSEGGKLRSVWHYRIFCDPSWRPILPRGEVYSREFTERGWLSFSELQNETARQLRETVMAQPGEQ